MKLAFSAIAWDPSLDDEVAAVLSASGFQGVELAPTKLWADLSSVTSQEAEAERTRWSSRGLPVVALQALLFGRPDLVVFGDKAETKQLQAYLLKVVELGGRLGARALVFGSPRNRLRGSLPAAEAHDRALEVLSPVAEYAERLGTCLCIEPNPPQYGADFVTAAAEGLRLVKAAKSGGFGLHLDTACMALAGDDLGVSIQAASGVLKHFHASEPHLAALGEDKSSVDHPQAARALVACQYGGFVSVEMRPVPKDPMAGIARAARTASLIYDS